jgi:hypothetical protein
MSQSNDVNPQSVTHGVELKLDTAIDGCTVAFPPGLTSLTIRGVSYTQATLEAQLVSLDARFKSARSAHAALHQFAIDRAMLEAAARQFLADLRSSLAGAVGINNQLLAQWGFPVVKPPKPLTSEEKLLRAAKAKLTRQKRGTLGKRQKAALKQTTAPTVQVNADGTSVVIASPPPAPSGPAGATPPVQP